MADIDELLQLPNNIGEGELNMYDPYNTYKISLKIRNTIIFLFSVKIPLKLFSLNHNETLHI